MNELPASLQKQVPDAVFRKLETMDESAQLGFAEEFARKKKSPMLGFLLVNSGLHYAYIGRVWMTILFLSAFGGLGVWWFVDLFRASGMVRDHNRSIAIRVLRDIQVLR